MTSSLFSRRRFIANTVAAAILPAAATASDNDSPDICVYGGTASGVMAAVTAVKQGRTAVIVEPSRWLGGMTGGGLSHVDWGRAWIMRRRMRWVVRWRFRPRREL